MGHFQGSFTLRPVPNVPKVSGSWIVRAMKRFFGGLGNPVTMVFRTEVGDPFAYVADDGARYEPRLTFETDGATTPRALWWIKGFAPMDWLQAAVIHDYLFEMHHLGLDIISYDEANELLAEMCRALGVSNWKVCLIYTAVTILGSNLWDYHYTASGEPDFSRPVDATTK